MMLVNRGIHYVPDFLNNRMGIVNCSNEMYGYVKKDPARERHFGRKWKHSIFNATLEVLKESKEKNIGTDQAAKSIADKLATIPHPIWGDRSSQIIKSVVLSGWEKKKSSKK